MPEENTSTTTETSETTVETNNGQLEGNAETLAAQQNSEAQHKTFTQAEVDQIFAKRLQKAVKAEIRKLSSEEPDKPNLDELQRKLEASEAKSRSFETREAVTDFLADPRNKMIPRPDSVRAIQKLVLGEIEYEDDGSISNLKAALEKVKSEAPSLFVINANSANAGSGRNSTTAAASADMNSFIRERASR